MIKIRPKWGWNISELDDPVIVSIIKIRPKWGWNEGLGVKKVLYGPLLKSDQNGVEIAYSGVWQLCLLLLKSDQNGVEI